MPEAVRTTSPAAVMRMRTALGKTFWTVEARGFVERGPEAPRSGETAMTSPAARAAVAMAVSSRFRSTNHERARGGWHSLQTRQDLDGRARQPAERAPAGL